MTDGLLLIHAWPLDARMWEPQLAAFTTGVAVAAPHLPGFGGSRSAGEVMTMADGAQRCTDELDEAGLDRVVVCGLSMGGYVAFELWRSARERIMGLVLANTRAVADTEEARAGRYELADRLEREGTGPLIAQPPQLLSPSAPQELWDTVVGLIADQSAEAIGASARGIGQRPDSTPDLAGIDVPTLVITSTEDGMIPADVSTSMADGIPDADVVTIEGVGHLTNLEAPDAFNDAVRAHLARCGLL